MENLQAFMPGWETVRCIGSGSSGKVYELKKKDEYGGDYSSALKVISIPSSQKEYDEMQATMSEFAMRAKLRDKVEEISSEYRLMGVLRGHPNIVNCEDQMIVPHASDLGWDIYIRMELLRSLPEYVNEKGMPISEVIRLGMDICSALELCRDNNIIHRDIKPQNIFVSRYSGYKLGDFSVAMNASAKGSSDMAGTYSYMAPEMYKGKPYDSRVDIYSLGMVMYCLLNEQRCPFLPLDEKPTQAQIGEAQLRRFRGDALPAPKYGSPALKELVLKACSFDPEKRFRSPADMKRALVAVMSKKSQPVQELFDSEATVRETIPVQRASRPASTVSHAVTELIKEKPDVRKPVEKPETEPKKKSSGASVAVIILSSIAFLLLIAIVCIIAFGGEGENKPVKTKDPVESTVPSEEIKVSAVILSSPRLIITEGDDANLGVSCVPDIPDGKTMPELSWKSSDVSIAAVDENGRVEGIKEGTATVIVYLKSNMEIYDECMVIVEKPVVTKLEIVQLPTKTVYAIGEPLDTTGMVLKAYYNNGTETEITDSNEYTVECPMEGLGSRSATVYYEGVTAEYTVRISLFG